MPRTLFSDADNRLWDTNAVYERAQLRLLNDVEASAGARAPVPEAGRLDYLRAIDQRIADQLK
ncbi:MAG TPA: hypothetical protein VK665_00580, partial [Candidatus Elarobacter sp.]|nr:hypothetical protein [Candidatus Elarobacter sp.]